MQYAIFHLTHIGAEGCLAPAALILPRHDPVPELPDRPWRLKYTPDDGNLVNDFYLPALRCAVRYDRSTGYFSASALALAMRGIEELVRNDGRMRLVVGCTPDPGEVEAIRKGESLRDAVGRHLATRPLEPPDEAARDALELLAWMVASGILEVKVAVPCDSQRKPIASDGIFHEKAGVITDVAGNRLAFNGSINETASGWTRNWESFNVFTSWSGTAEYVDREVADFARIWANKAKRVLTLDVPDAARADLLRFMPKSALPARLNTPETMDDTAVDVPRKDGRLPEPTTRPAEQPPPDRRREVWRYIRRAPTRPDGGERVGEATCSVEPWPHQAHAFQRLYSTPEPRLLIADEVGLGKTIQAGMLLRQMWLAERAKRILVLAPAGVMRQWQLELREKFNLNWPIYDNGHLIWYPSPALSGRNEREVSRSEWHNEPFVIASSQLMRRRDREKELCEDAEPWDLIVLDEAHHARRRGAGSAAEEGPNALLRLMRRLEGRARGLLLLTATPMQVHPVELWDLLSLLGMPDEWGEHNFLRFFELVAKPAPSAEEFEELARLFRASEVAYGATSEGAVVRLGVTKKLRARRILSALRDKASIPRRRLSAEDRGAAIRIMRATTPVTNLVSRHTRELLRRYHREGKLDVPIADRDVRDEFIELTQAERAAYEAVENYIATTYNQAAAKRKNAVGFVMTVYRRRLASSFRALRCTLESRLAPLSAAAIPDDEAMRRTGEDILDDDSSDELMDVDEASELEREALKLEELTDVEALLRQVAILPIDSKARKLENVLEGLLSDGYSQVMVFTQFTDTMDFLRSYLTSKGMKSILCFSGRGGEVPTTDGRWQVVSRDDVKRRFRESAARVLLCTDAAAEGLNFQFCGAIVNYEMPWNPMRVEQRIGRVDRLGQLNPVIRIVNLHYSGTVEADVYMALRKRIGLFQSVVGRLQPILAELPRTFMSTALRNPPANAEVRARVASEVAGRVDSIDSNRGAIDIDLLATDVLDLPKRAEPALDMVRLDEVLRQRELLPDGVAVRGLGEHQYGYLASGMDAELRVTTDPRLYEEHAGSMELWSQGSPVFPDVAELAGEGEAGTGMSAAAHSDSNPNSLFGNHVQKAHARK